MYLVLCPTPPPECVTKTPDVAPPPKPPRRRRGNEFSLTPLPESVTKTKTTPDQSPSHLATDKKEAISCILGAIARRAPLSPPKDTARRANGDISINGTTTLQTEEREKEVDKKKNDAFVVIDYLTREKGGGALVCGHQY